MRNAGYTAYHLVLIFGVTFGGKMGVTTTRVPKGMGPHTPIISLAHFWVNCYLVIMFWKFSDLTPIPLSMGSMLMMKSDSLV